MSQTIVSRSELDALRRLSFPQPGEVYISNPALDDAAKAAMLLRQPLLLTGEPGTGKTTLGYKLARDLNWITRGTFHAEPLYFATKSVSAANDLFYTYDAVSHFRNVNIDHSDGRPAGGAADFITLQPLGIAILAGNRSQLKDYPALLSQLPAEESNSFVIIIDEIDKAPRDFPNDILHEIESLSFGIKELGNKVFSPHPDANIFIILTSNSEKTLPEAFLRRCVFHYIEFPGEDNLKEILMAHRIATALGEEISEGFAEQCVGLFTSIRERCSDKRPSTSELVGWVKYLVYHGYDFDRADEGILHSSLSIIVKSKSDIKHIIESGIII